MTFSSSSIQLCINTMLLFSVVWTSNAAFPFTRYTQFLTFQTAFLFISNIKHKQQLLIYQYIYSLI